jgi:hypothetical protein
LRNRPPDSRPLEESAAKTHEWSATHGVPDLGDQCGQVRLRRRHRWIVRRSPGGRGERLPVRSGHPGNDTAASTVVCRSGCCSAGRWSARARWSARGGPSERPRRQTVLGSDASPWRGALHPARRQRGRITGDIRSGWIPQGSVASIPRRRPVGSHLRTRPGRVRSEAGRSDASGAAANSVDAAERKAVTHS